MCTGVEIAAIAAIGGTAATTYGVVQAENARSDAKAEAARAAEDRRKAEADAQGKAGARTAMLRKAIAANSLYTGAGSTSLATPATAGRSTLGV
jgi:membrane protein involved in colicin uptake